MDINRYEFINPFAGEWNNYEFVIRENSREASKEFDLDCWEVEHRITLTRKPESIKAGQGWWDDSADFETETVEIIGILEYSGVTYVAYVDYQGLSHLLQENNFRSHFHRNLSE